MKDTYITATLEMIVTGDDATKVISGLKKTLTERGHERLLAPVLQGVLRKLEASATTTTTLTVARADDATTHQAAITAALEELGTPDTPAVTIDPTLVGGFVAEHNNQRVDQSYKTKLVTLYRSLTS